MATEITEGYALSPQQERVWLLQQHIQKLPYRVQCAIRIEGPVDWPLFTTAVQQVVERHEILRTTFHDVPGMTIPVQAIGHTSPALPQVDDLSGLAAEDQAARIEALWREAQQRPFDFAHGPLLQLASVRLAAMRHMLLCSMPALCADRTTLTHLARDLSRTYAASVHGETLSDTPLQYVDFATWHSALLADATGEAERAYWQQQLNPDLLHVKLGGEQPCSDTTGFTPRAVPVSLPPEVVARIATLVRPYHTSPAVFMLACWTLLLWRHIGQAEVLVGTACDGRNYAPLTDALGLFVRYVPIRCAMQAHEPFSALLARLHTATHTAYRQQEYFAWEAGAAQHNDGTGVAFFPLCFEYVEQPAMYAGAGITFVIDRLDACMDRFTVKLACTHTDGRLSVALHYDAQCFQTATITCLAEQLQTLLASASQHPETALDQCEMLSAAARQRVVVTFNQTQTSTPDTQCLHHLFEAQTARTPDRVAVVYDEHSLTYAALNARANQLAHHLRQHGVGPEVRVGICMSRSLDMVVGILGILKAGGAYVPLDPTYPRERLAFMAADVQASLLLTQAALLEALPQQGPGVLCLDTAWDAMAQHSAVNPVSAVTPAHLAYVIYTSGSTGQPKGVLVTHRNVVHSTQARLLYYQAPVASFLLLSSFAFDSSIAGIFWTLSQGGRLILPSAGHQGDPAHLTTLLTQHHVSHLLSLPSLHALLLEQACGAQLDALEVVIVAGEACTRALVARHYARLPDVALFNEYGPTEGTVWSSVYQCQVHDTSLSVPIGRPIANIQIYLLNARLQPVPLGVPGELYIGGAGVTVGYSNRPAFTAERFLPHAFSAGLGARLYKTGDLGRYRTDGSIEFLGRTDHQVKIRGFRIELGEIEAVLHDHPAIAAAVVLARDEAPKPFLHSGPAEAGLPGQADVSRQKRLIAYLVAKQNPPPSPAELRRFLQAKLPDYMIPALFVQLDALPLAPNGKIDHQALPDAERLRTALDAIYVAPHTEVERAMALIWQNVLQVEPVGIHDNFFDLGGHSLAMVQVHSSLQALYSTAISLIDMFRYPTISTLAQYVSQEEHEPSAVQPGAERAARRQASRGRQRQARQERRLEHESQRAPYE